MEERVHRDGERVTRYAQAFVLSTKTERRNLAERDVG